MHAGRRAVTVGRELFDARARKAGLEIMGHGRQVIAEGLRGHAHESLVAVDFELALALAEAGRLRDAASRCDALVETWERLPETARLVLCPANGTTHAHVPYHNHARTRAIP